MIASPTPRPYARLLIVLLGLVSGLVFGLWLFGTPGGVLGKADAVGYAICHRIAERSFTIHDHGDSRPLPLCARCTGLYLGVAAGLGFFAARGRLRAARLPAPRLLLILLLTGLAYAADGFNSYLSMFAFYQPVYSPHNTLRLITGLGFGVGMITVVLPVFNSLAWRAPQNTAPLRSLRDLLALAGIAAGIAAAVVADVPAVRVLAGVISAAGVVLMFGLIGTVMFLMLTRRENSFTRWRDLAIPALAGLAFAISVIGTIDLIRYLLTGNWDGFSLV